MKRISKVCTEERLAQLHTILQSGEDEAHQASGPKIQRVPYFLKQNEEFAKYWSPKLISIGPIHHHLKLGEQYKLTWTAIHVEEYSKQTNQETKRAAQVLHERIEDNIEELKKLFTEDAIKDYNDKDLVWMLFVDGCSVLQFMEKVDVANPNALKLKIDQLNLMWRDLLLLENQIPYKVLELLTKDMSKLEELNVNFACMGIRKYAAAIQYYLRQQSKPKHLLDKPKHLLDLTRSVFLGEFNNDHEVKITTKNQQHIDEQLHVWQRYKNLRDLKAAGIQVKAQENYSWSSISFTSKSFSGELKLPKFVFTHITPYFFWNLKAYEACPDFQNNFQCSSYFAFMDLLIDDAEDVKELRLAGVMQNLLATDEDVANLFNSLGTDLVANSFNCYSTDLMVYSRKYIRIREQIERHCKNKYKTWMSEFYNTHFNSPWAMLAFLAAVLAIVLTFIQTWFTIHPKQ